MHLHEVEARCPIAGHTNDLAFRARKLRADRRGNAGTQHAEFENVVIGTGARRGQGERGPERGIASVYGVDGLSSKDLADGLHHMCGMNALARPFRDRLQPDVRRVAIDLPVSSQVVRLVALDLPRFENLNQPFECRPGIRHDSHFDGPRHADVSRVNVDLNDLLGAGVPPVFVEGKVEIAKPGANDEYDVRFLSNEIAALAKGEHELIVVAPEGGPTRHAGQDRATKPLGQALERRVRISAIHTCASHDRGALGAPEHFGRLFKL